MGLWRGWRHNRVDVGERNAEVQGWAAGVVHADRSRRTRRPLGSKPKLWDLKGIVLAKLKDKAGWAVMKPLSVEYTDTAPSLPEYENIGVTLHRDVRESRRKAFVRWLKGVAPLPPPPSPPPRPPAQLHLTVAVAMPVPDSQKTAKRVPVYELGMLSVPWDTEKMAAVNSNTVLHPSHAAQR